MDLVDMWTVVFLEIAEIGSTPGIDTYLTAAQGGDPVVTSRVWNMLTAEEQAIIQRAYLLANPEAMNTAV